MKQINIHKAIRTLKDRPTESVEIKIDEEAMEFTNLGLQDIHQSSEAKQLETALYYSLPGGVYDRLFAVMAFRKCSHFRVAHEQEEVE